jgi:peptide chain release factor 3
LFRTVELADPMRSKQLRQGLQELGEEGAIQVFRPVAGSLMLLGAVGQLQFEVVAHRLKAEYGVDVRMSPSNHAGARWVTADDPIELRRFIDSNPSRMALDAADTHAYLMSSRYDLELTQERWPKIKFHLMREHAGLVLQGG